MKYSGIRRIGLIAFLVAISFVACDKNENLPPLGDSNLKGTGDYVYTGYAPLADKPVRVFYHVPAGATALAPVLVVFHGAARDAGPARDAMIAQANAKGFLLVAPEFSAEYFPGADMYNLGNIFEDGDNPSPETLNPEAEWTFSIVGPLVEDFKTRTGNMNEQFDTFGHSAGAQFAHRLLLFKPDLPVDGMVASASGWYTVPDPGIDFPYGLGQSPAESANMSLYFGEALTVMVGALDTDPNSFDLRHNEWADAQGLQRVERAQHFYNRGAKLAGGIGAEFYWTYAEVPGVGHEFAPLAAAAVEILY